MAALDEYRGIFRDTHISIAICKLNILVNITEDNANWGICQVKRSGNILGTLSSGNADGDGDAETCEEIGERTPL